MQEKLPADFFERLVRGMPDAVIYADREGFIRFWNAGAEALFGHPPAAALGRSLDLIIPETLRPRHWEGYRRVMAGAPSRYGRELLAVPALHAGGETLSVEFSIVLLCDAASTPEGVAAVVRDVTARRAREKALKGRLAELEGRLAAGPLGREDLPG